MHIYWMHNQDPPPILHKELAKLNWASITIICIGTDRSTGDALGPLVGSRLEKHGIPVIGTLDNPATAVNLQQRLTEVKTEKILAIDACLANSIEKIGTLELMNTPLKPGTGVGKDLPAIGDWHIKGMVNVGGFMEYHVLSSTRLSLVMSMVETISDVLIRAHWGFSWNQEVASTKQEGGNIDE